MDNPVYVGIRDAKGTRLYQMPQEDLDLREMSKKMEANRKAREEQMRAEMAKQREQIAIYEAQRNEIQRENLRREKALEARKLRMIRMGKCFLGCAMIESIMFCLWWFGACQPVVPLITLSLCGMALSYQAGSLKSGAVG